jgi:hypothetical protein
MAVVCLRSRGGVLKLGAEHREVFFYLVRRGLVRGVLGGAGFQVVGRGHWKVCVLFFYCLALVYLDFRQVFD